MQQSILSNLECCSWFDDFLNPEDQFIKSCLFESTSQYSKQFTQIINETNDLFGRLSEMLCDQILCSRFGHKIVHWMEAKCQHLKAKLPQLEHIAEFKETFPQFSTAASNATFIFVRAVTSFCNTNTLENVVLHTQEIVELRSVSDLAAKLNDVCEGKRVKESVLVQLSCRCDHMLLIAQLLRGVDARADELLTQLEHQFSASLLPCCSQIMSLLQSPAELYNSSEIVYAQMHSLLSYLSSIDKYCQVSNHLPGFAEAKAIARSGIENQFEATETLILESSNCDLVASQMACLKEATVLDSQLDGLVASKLEHLSRIRDTKQAGMDERLTARINSCEFDGLSEYLKPLRDSKDQLRKGKFNEYAMHITKTVQSHFSCISVKLVPGSDVENGIEMFNKLQHASEDLQTLCLSRFNIRGSLDRVKNEISLHFDQVTPYIHNLFEPFVITKVCVQMLSSLETAIELCDYVAMGEQQPKLEEYHKWTMAHLSKKRNQRHAKTISECEDSLAAVQTYVKQFVDLQAIAKTDTTRLLTVLCNLKQTCSNPRLEKMAACYKSATQTLSQQLQHLLQNIVTTAERDGIYSDAVESLSYFKRELHKGLQEHVKLKIDIDACTTKLVAMQNKYDVQLQRSFSKFDVDYVRNTLVPHLDQIQPNVYKTMFGTFQFSSGVEYRRNLNLVKRQISDLVSSISPLLRSGSYMVVNTSLTQLQVCSNLLQRHADLNNPMCNMQAMISNHFKQVCESIGKALCDANISQLENQFERYQNVLLHLPITLFCEQAETYFHSTNEMLFVFTFDQINSLDSNLKEFRFKEARLMVEKLRMLGKFLAGSFVGFYEELKFCENEMQRPDQWLNQLSQLSHTHFMCCSQELAKLYAVLGVQPGASAEDVKQAYHRKLKRWHPDKHNKGSGVHQMYRSVEAAFQTLSKSNPILAQPFDSWLQTTVPSNLRLQIKESLQEEAYDQIAPLLFRLGDLHILKHLVNPPLDSERIVKDVHTLVKAHVDEIRIAVTSNWSQRRLGALRDNFTSLNRMETSFSTYPDIYLESWSKKIIGEIEHEINTLATHAQSFVSSGEKIAFAHLMDFQLDLIKMGHVFDEIPILQEFVFCKMNTLLVSCLDDEWGYAYIFQLGLSLQNGEYSNEEDEHVARVIVSEFQCFKDVTTMVWNEEVLQKPAEDTIQDIYTEGTTTAIKEFAHNGPLLQAFNQFQEHYSTALSQYLSVDAELDELISQILQVAQQIGDCQTNLWEGEVKAKIPLLLALVFAHFTVLKSGDGFQRLDDDGGGNENLLLKPHQIQIMSILCMLSCDRNDTGTLCSRLMQVRTGEGKSIILGATATILALLKFQVRCVCYSEYLSERDYDLFRDIFEQLGIVHQIRYSKITTLSEEQTAAKGDIRRMTQDLIGSNGSGSKSTEHCRLPISANGSGAKSVQECRTLVPGSGDSISNLARGQQLSKLHTEEILLVDEVDVFFGRDFYGQTYNEVTYIKEPEISEILFMIWENRGHRQQLRAIQNTDAYKKLLTKYQAWDFLINNELAMMIDQVGEFNQPAYHLDRATDRIGYKVMDSISYEITYGYRSIFAYLHEASLGNLRKEELTLSRIMCLQISCGQFSYANISPSKILGVSGEFLSHSYAILTALFYRDPSSIGKLRKKCDEPLWNRILHLSAFCLWSK